jgi:hypothetical protein
MWAMIQRRPKARGVSMSSEEYSPTGTTAPGQRKRFWLVLIGLPLLVLILSSVVWCVRMTSELQTAIAEAERLDPRWRLEEIEADRLTPPPGQNAADKILEIQRVKPARPWPDTKKDALLSDIPPEHQLNDQQIVALNDLLEPAGPALLVARSVMDVPRGRYAVTHSPNFIGTLLPMLQEAREAANLLRFDAYAKAQANDADGAVRSCHAALNVGSSIGDEPILISQLVRIACQMIAINGLERTLAQGEPSDTVLTTLQARMETIEAEPLFLFGLRGERAGANQLLENLRNGTVPVNGFARLMQTDSTLDAMLRIPGFITVQQTGHLQYMNEMVAIARLPPEMWVGRLAEHQAKLSQLPIVARLLVTQHSKFAEAFQRNHASHRCAIVAIAAERYRRANGQWPATPEELVKAGLLKEVPTDPFASSQSIKLARPADGLIVYTTGQDGKDDGGKLNPDPRKAGTDFGFRLWDVAARRQSPLPTKPAEAP